MPDSIPCPQCGTPAQITERFRLGSTDGSVEYLKTGCVNNHWLTPLAEMGDRERPAVLDRDLAALPPDPIRPCRLLGVVGRAAEEPRAGVMSSKTGLPPSNRPPIRRWAGGPRHVRAT